MNNNFWLEFSILLLAAICGSIAILPYSLRLLKESPRKKPIKMPIEALLALSVLQNAILFSVLIGIGLTAAHQVGLGAPLIEAIIAGKGFTQAVSALLLPFVLGIFGGATLLLIDLRFLPHFPEKLITTVKNTTQWENFTSSFYGGINEELAMRLFGFSVIAWLLSRIWHTSSGMPTTAVFMFANIIMAVVFALGHLPALKNLLGSITQIILLRTLILNIAIGLICGWVFWNYGIEAAIFTHFTADIVYHVGGTYVLRSKNYSDS